ncbi:RteC domain-containing protein [Polaribacter sp. R77954]|uniref:RteC domain-containing protein n=1 Tax=Polaribacter sp. R77954 TaxID=3093870 RepID=UPI0037C8DBF0
MEFFKYQKPKLQGCLFFYGTQLTYYLECPKVGSELQKQYLKKSIKRLENRKKRNLEFFFYYTQKETISDNLYFLRKNIQLSLFAKNFQMNKYPLFNTNKSTVAAEITGNRLCIDFFNKELNTKFKNKKEVKPEVLTNLSWTGSKTDLVELLFALKESGAIRNGNSEIKKLKEVCEVLFNIKLGNIHKTFSQIKARQKDPTKFLDTLKNGLLQKINYDPW